MHVSCMFMKINFGSFTCWQRLRGLPPLELLLWGGVSLKYISEILFVAQNHFLIQKLFTMEVNINSTQNKVKIRICFVCFFIFIMEECLFGHWY